MLVHIGLCPTPQFLFGVQKGTEKNICGCADFSLFSLLTERNQKMINILAVEKNQKTASLIYSALSDRSRYHLAIVESGYTALEAITQKNFDLIIIDRDLTFLSGIKTAINLRKKLTFDISPFIITCNNTLTEEEAENFIRTGVFDFWEPPFSVQRIKLTADSIAQSWSSPKDNLKSYKEYLERIS